MPAHRLTWQCHRWSWLRFIIDLRTDFGITGANALTYVQPDEHGGTLISGGSNALRGMSGDVASIDLVGVAPSQLTAAQFA